ncbi:MAG: oligosaccharide flippase family protein [Actinobacteria bacterium]|nr:oligosaccharide flippase family protein [Actinomycetota bacterium]
MPDTGGRSPALVGRQIGGVWTVQVIQVVAQIGYAAVTSRLIDPEGFAQYAVALAIFAVIGLVAVMGLGNAAARRVDDDLQADRRLVSYGLVLGLAAAVFTVLAAGVLGALWAADDAVGAIRLISVAIAFLPWATVLAGILRRQGRISVLNRSTLAAGLLSIGFGLPIVVLTGEPWALVLTPVLNQVLLTGLCAVRLGRRALPSLSLRGGRPDLVFGSKSMTLSALNQFAYYGSLWVLSRVGGPTVFGSWNRALVVGQLPQESATRAAVTVIFPFFRNARVDPRSEARAWTDMLTVSCLVVLPASGVAIPLMPDVVEVLLGDQWGLAAAMAGWIWAAAAVTVLRTLLGAALEASNTFGPLWWSQAVIVIVYVAGAVGVWLTGDWAALAVALLIAAVASHLAQILGAGDLLHWRSLFLGYGLSLLLSFGLAVIAFGIARTCSQAWLCLLLGVLLEVLFVAALWWRRDTIGPFRRLWVRP